MNIAEWSVQHARSHGNELALIEGDWSCSNAQLQDCASRLARALLDMGAVPGDRIALTMPNCSDLYIAAAAVVHAGMVLVVLADDNELEIAHRLEHCAAKVVIARDRATPSTPLPRTYVHVSTGAAASGERSTFVLSDLIAQHIPLQMPVARESEDPAQLCYTSGSTGVPKAAIYTHGRLDAYLRARRSMMSQNGAPLAVLLAVPPTAFASGFIAMRVVANQCYVLHECFEPEAVLATIERHGIHLLPLLPTLAEQLVATKPRRHYDCSSLRAIHIGGARVSSSLVKLLESTFLVHSSRGAGPADHNGPRIVVYYGMTETGGAIASSETGGTPGDDSVGRVVPGVQVRIIGPDGTDAAAGHAGEVVVDTPYAAVGYWNDPGRSAAVFRDGLVHTGDLGRFNSEGELCLMGRLKELINQGGYKVLPAELISLLEGLPGVAECAVIGLDDPLMGEEVVVCIVRSEGARVTERDVLASLIGVLDRRKLPGQIVFLHELPHTPGGKLDILELKARVLSRRDRDLSANRRLVHELPAERRARYVRDAVLTALLESLPSAPRGTLCDEATFGELGLDSLGCVRMTHKLGERLGVRLAATTLYSNPTPARLCAILQQQLWDAEGKAKQPETRASAAALEPVAIVGIGCRLPGANDAQAFWRLIERGTDATGPVPPERSPADGASWRGGFLGRVGDFDAPFFRLEAHAAQLDPRHRMILEVAWEACENAGQNPLALSGERTGVFLGLSGERYETRDPLGRSPGMATGYLCHFLDLRGPVLCIDTTCSSSLVAIHSAVNSLQQRECDVALVGGANFLMADAGHFDLGVISPQGRSRSFDADADGFGQGEGCIMFVLKRLASARRDHDRIYATILGTAINHDGRSSSLTAPNPNSQAAVIRNALQRAGLAPEAVQYIEAHGTGTLQGDPLEVEGLASVFRHRTGPALAIGSVKTNIGHLEAAAGAAGVAKVALAIARDRLPPSLHFNTPNPRIAWRDIPIRVQTQSGRWPNSREPRIAGVSSFGMSGTNAHAILGEPPREDPTPVSRPAHTADSSLVVPLSAKTPRALRAGALRLADALAGELRDLECADIAYTAGCRRAHLEERAAIVGDSHAQWIHQLRAIGQGSRADRPTAQGSSRRRLVIAFSGQGTQWPGMGQELFDREPVFREAMLRCAECIDRQVAWHLVEEIARDERDSRLGATEVAQPALFAMQFALWELLRSWGVTADAVIGHSLGEVTAACVAGALSLSDAARLVCERGRIIQHCAPAGAMLHVAVGAHEARELCAEFADSIEVAAINGPRATTLSGDLNTISTVRAVLLERHVSEKLLHVDRAYHSSKMDAAATRLVAALPGLGPGEMQLPVISTVTGKPLSSVEAGYWGEQLRSCVRFHDATCFLLDQGDTVFLELGPHPVLRPLIQEAIDERQEPRSVAIASLRRGSSERRCLAEALAGAYCAGAEVDWSKRYPSGKLVDLPGYAWDHARHWHSQSTLASASLQSQISSESDVDREAAVRDYVLDMLASCARIAKSLVQPESRLSLLGLNSLDLIEIRSRLASELGIRLDAATLGPDPTCGALLAACLKRDISPCSAGDRRFAWLRRVGGKPTCVWIHPVGGGVECYGPLARSLPFDSGAIEVVRVDRSRAGHESVEALASSYLSLLQQHHVDTPMILGGWSFGGLVAYEMASQLRRRGSPVPLVVLIDSYVVGASEELARAILGGQPAEGEHSECVSLEAKRGFLANHSIQRNGRELPAEEVARLYAVLHHHLELARRYRPSSCQGPVLSLRASERFGDPDAVWRTVAGELIQETVAADHYSILRGPALESLSHAVCAFASSTMTAAHHPFNLASAELQ